MGSDNICLRSNAIPYIQAECLRENRDVLVTSKSGKSHGINRAILAAGSRVLCQAMLGLYSCPLANSDDTIHIRCSLYQRLRHRMAFTP